MTSILGLIPARGGSRRVPRKNMRLLQEFPLIAWTFEAAFQSHMLEYLVVSSEDFASDSLAKRPKVAG